MAVLGTMFSDRSRTWVSCVQGKYGNHTITLIWYSYHHLSPTLVIKGHSWKENKLKGQKWYISLSPLSLMCKHSVLKYHIKYSTANKQWQNILNLTFLVCFGTASCKAQELCFTLYLGITPGCSWGTILDAKDQTPVDHVQGEWIPSSLHYCSKTNHLNVYSSLKAQFCQYHL